MSKKCKWIICIIVLIIIVAIVYVNHNNATKLITEQNLIIQSTKDTDQYKIQITGINKEKGKEDIYVIEFQYMQNESTGYKLNVPKTIYESKIGSGNNVITMTHYKLNIMNKRPGRLENYYVGQEYDRYDLFDETEFTYDNSKELISKTVKNINNYITNGDHNDVYTMSSSSEEESNIDWITKNRS